MAAPTIKLREKKQECPPRPLRMSLPGELEAELDAYRRLYAEAHEQEIGLPDVIIAILMQFLESDRNFQRWKRTASAARNPGGH